MAYKCMDCGHIFDECEILEWDDYRGEHFGAPSYEKMAGCPMCRGGFEETIECESCHGEFIRDELVSGLCPDCVQQIVDSYKKNLRGCLEIGQKAPTEIEINGLLAHVFSKVEIEEILLRELDFLTILHGADFSGFIEEDIDWFIETVKAERSKINESQARG